MIKAIDRQLVKNYRDMVREIEEHTEKAFQEFFQNNFYEDR